MTHALEKGTAYAFFKGPSDPVQLRVELPHIMAAVGTPRTAYATLSHGRYDTADRELDRIAQTAHDAGLTYVMKVILDDARGPGSNGRAADEAATVLNQAYNTSLWNKGDQFCGEIVSRRGRGYEARD